MCAETVLLEGLRAIREFPQWTLRIVVAHDSLARPFSLLASLVAPPLCAACGESRAEGGALCEGCGDGLASARPVVDASGPPGVDLVVAASPYDGLARRIAHGLKYARRLSLAKVAAEAMVAALPGDRRADAVVPVPAAPWRRRWRGFDPAEEIAIAVGERTGIPVAGCLGRSGGRRQVGRRRSERLSHPPRVWAVGEVPVEALLIDDVWTTGATLSACASALRASGCRRVVALTFAHATNALAGSKPQA